MRPTAVRSRRTRDRLVVSRSARCSRLSAAWSGQRGPAPCARIGSGIEPEPVRSSPCDRSKRPQQNRNERWLHRFERPACPCRGDRLDHPADTHRVALTGSASSAIEGSACSRRQQNACLLPTQADIRNRRYSWHQRESRGMLRMDGIMSRCSRTSVRPRSA